MSLVTLGIIPARGGSRGIPRKNLVPLAGEPLIAWTCRAALGARRLTRVIASTDDQEIAAAARGYGVDVPFLRPSALAEDWTPTLPVIAHALDMLEGEGFVPDAVVILQPTSPLRRAEHIDEAVDLLEQSGADSVVSVVEVPHHFNPVSVLRIDDRRLVPFLPGEGLGPTRRQDKPTVFARNGAAVYAVRAAVIRQGDLFGSDCRPLVMTREESIDIDDAFDLAVAEAVLARRGR